MNEKPPQDPEFTHIWTIYSDIKDFEHHFNNLVTKYRTLASTWLLATFGGVGFVISKDMQWDLINEAALIALIGFFGLVGVWLIWLMDLMVYQRLLGAAFDEGKALEDRCDWLPRIRHNMANRLPGGHARSRLAWFYVLGIAAPWTIFLGGSSVWVHELINAPGSRFASQSVLASVLVALILATVFYFIGWTIYQRSIGD